MENSGCVVDNVVFMEDNGVGKVVVVTFYSNGNGGWGGNEEVGAVCKPWEWLSTANRYWRKKIYPKSIITSES